jgi:hypothetical protein
LGDDFITRLDYPYVQARFYPDYTPTILFLIAILIIPFIPFHFSVYWTSKTGNPTRSETATGTTATFRSGGGGSTVVVRPGDLVSQFLG